jgi:uncharacterized protein (DUF58 family)
MERLWRYYSSYQSVRGRMGGLPAWARTVLLIAALPGIAAIALSILAFIVSLLALLLLTVPLYQLLRALTGGGSERDATGSVEVLSGGAGPFSPFGEGAGPGRKRVEATVVEPQPPAAPEDTQSDESRVSHG